MDSAKQLVPQTRRLIDKYLMFGLACLLMSVGLSLALSWRGMLTTHVPLATVGPLVVLVVGVFVLRRTLWLNSEIEKQLNQIASVPASSDFDLEPIVDSAPAAVGWNSILERVVKNNTLASIEARLSESVGGLDQKHFERLLDSLPDGVAVADQDGAITMANNAFKVLLQDDPDVSMNGKSVSELLSLKWGRDSQQIVLKAQQPSAPIMLELQRSDEIADGVLRLARYALKNSDGDIISHVWSARDITQSKLADAMRNQFVITATHELRTPLSNIIAYAETLSIHDGIDVEQQKQFCNTIHAEATRLTRFVDELLNVSQMEAGSLALARHETDVERLLDEVVAAVQPTIHEKQIQFEYQVPPKLPKLHVDKEKFTASLVNLLGNAVK